MQTTINTKERTHETTASVIPDELLNRLENARALAGIFAFFSRCLEQEVDAEFLRALRGEFRQALTESGLSLSQDFFAKDEAELLEQLAEEYTGLFVAPGCVSPYASVFETGCMFKEPTDKAIAAYQQAGWDYHHVYSGEFPDHIGTMLGFYGLLCELEADYLTAGDIEAADQVSNERSSFLMEQLANWGPGWCHLASEAATVDFYQQILAMIEQALWSEISQQVSRRELRELAQLNQREPKRLDYDADFRKASGL